MSITTRGGDRGQTGLADGSRRAKDDLLIEVIGDVDELHASLGMMKAVLTDYLKRDEIAWIEKAMLRIGGMLAVPISHPNYSKLDRIDEEDIQFLESWQNELMEKVEMPRYFIIYGSNDNSARTDMARAICRRTERHIVRLIRQRSMNDLFYVQQFLNRLSDYLFVFARYQDAIGGSSK